LAQVADGAVLCLAGGLCMTGCRDVEVGLFEEVLGKTWRGR